MVSTLFCLLGGSLSYLGIMWHCVSLKDRDLVAIFCSPTLWHRLAPVRVKIYGKLWPRCPEGVLNIPVTIWNDPIYFLFAHIYVLVSLSPVSGQTREDAHASSSFPRSCLQEHRDLVFLIVHCCVPSTECSAFGDHLFQVQQNLAWKWSQHSEKKNWEMENRDRVQLAVLSPSEPVTPEASTPP